MPYHIRPLQCHPLVNDNILNTTCPSANVKESKTSSSAVAQRPHDALCPSIVSLNKIIHWVDYLLLPAIRSLERRARYLFYCMFFLFGQRFLDNPRADSHQSLHAGVLWFRMCLLPFWGLVAPADRKRGKWNFCYCSSQWGMFAFWRFFSNISATRGQNHTKFYLCRDNVCRRAPSPFGVHWPLGGGGGGVKNSKNGGWSHSFIQQLPFLFFSALPNVVQYVGHRPAHILV